MQVIGSAVRFGRQWRHLSGVVLVAVSLWWPHLPVVVLADSLDFRIPFVQFDSGKRIQSRHSNTMVYIPLVKEEAMCTIVAKLFSQQVCSELLLKPPPAGFSPHVGMCGMMASSWSCRCALEIRCRRM